MFLGEVKHQLDDKKRIRIPNKFRLELGDNFAFVKGPKCIRVYPKHVIEQQVAILKERVNPLDAKQSSLLGVYTRGIEFPIADNQGRIVVSKGFLEHANIDKDVVTIGVCDHLEIMADNKSVEQERENFDEALAELSKLFGN